MMVAMSRPTLSSVPTLLAIARVFPRLLPRTLLLMVAVIGVMFAALALVLTLAAPSAEQIAQALAEGTGTATLQLVLAGSWWVVPIGVMFVSMLTFTGMLMHFTDAAVTSKRAHAIVALTSTLTRVPAAATVALVYGVTGVLAIAAAPLITVLALAAFLTIVVTTRSGRTVPGWLPERSIAAALAIPFYLAGAIVIRWSLAFGEVFLAGSGWGDALRMSWERTAGRVRPVGTVLLVTFGGTLFFSWGLNFLGAIGGSAPAELALQLVGSLLVAPIPAITLLVLFRGVGGPGSPIAESLLDAPRMSPRRMGSGVSVAVSFALIITLLSPPPPVAAADVEPALPEVGVSVTETDGGEPPVAGDFVSGQLNRDLSLDALSPAAAFASLASEPTSVTLDHASAAQWQWEFGSPSTPIKGEVTTMAGASIPSGLVQLWGTSLDPADDPVTIGDPVQLVEGSFELDGVRVFPGIRKLWVEYLGDADHDASSSDVQLVNVLRKVLSSTGKVVAPTGTITVGDRVRVRIEIDPHGAGVPGHEFSGEVQLVDTMTNTVMGSAVAAGGFATIEFTMTRTALHLGMNPVDDTRYWLGAGSEWVVPAQPAASVTTLVVQQAVSLGTDALAIAEVLRPNGVPIAGTVDFFFTDGVGGAKTPLGAVAVNAQGMATLTFCVGESTNGTDPGGCAHTPRAIVGPAPSVLRVMAEFTPEPALLASASSWQTVEIHPVGTGGTGKCKIVQLSTRVLNMPHATIDQLESVGAPVLQSRSNCSTTDTNTEQVLGYRDGSVLTLHARPKPGYELVEWIHNGRVRVGTQNTLVWLMPDDPTGWYESFEPVYQPRCVTVDVRLSGHGKLLSAYPSGAADLLAASPSCQKADGTKGAYLGTTMRVTVEGTINPVTGERDAFRSALANGSAISDTSPYSASAGSPERQELRFQPQRDTVVTVNFGPTCRTVQTEVSYFTPDARHSNLNTFGDRLPATRPTTGMPELLTAPNCDSPAGIGWYRNSEVTVAASPDGPFEVVGGWRVNGELRKELGTSQQVTVVVGDPAVTTIEYDVAYCYPVEVGYGDGVWSRGNNSHVTVEPAPNCSDGSERHAQGTTVKLTPWAGVAGGRGMTFGGWTDDILNADGVKVDERITGFNADVAWYRPGVERAAGTVSRSGVRTVELQAPLITTAHFYAEEACSEFTIVGALRLADVRLSDTSCGPGRYFDVAKLNLPADGVYSGHQLRPDGSEYPADNRKSHERVEEQMRQQYYEHDLHRYPFTTLSFEVPGRVLDVYGTVSMTQESPSQNRWTWRLKEGLACTGVSCSLNVRGDVQVQLVECQGLDVTVNLQVVGDESKTVYSPEDLGLEDFDWVVSETDGCGSGLAWAPGMKATLRAQAPIVGMEFLDWSTVDNLVGLEWFVNHEPTDPRSPLAVHVRATDSEKAMKIEVDFAIHCAELKLDGVMGIVEPAPNCPGTPAGMSYMVGTFVMVAASRVNQNGRHFVRFNNGTVIHSTEGVLDIAPAKLHGFDPDRAWVTNMVKETAKFKELKKQPSNWTMPTQQLPDYDFHTGITLVQYEGQVIAGYYQHSPTTFENLGATMANVGKMMVGVTMLGLTAAMPFCPPCAAAVTVLTVSEYLVRLIPGGDFLGNIIAMANPMNFIECTTKWGFGNLDRRGPSETGDLEFGKSLAGAIAAGGAAAYKQNVVINDPAKLERFEKWSKMGKSGAAAATFAYGLYENKFWEVQFANASASDLRDTAAYEECLADTWKDPTT